MRRKDCLWHLQPFLPHDLIVLVLEYDQLEGFAVWTVAKPNFLWGAPAGSVSRMAGWIDECCVGFYTRALHTYDLYGFNTQTRTFSNFVNDIGPSLCSPPLTWKRKVFLSGANIVLDLDDGSRTPLPTAPDTLLVGILDDRYLVLSGGGVMDLDAANPWSSCHVQNLFQRVFLPSSASGSDHQPTLHAFGVCQVLDKGRVVVVSEGRFFVASLLDAGVQLLRVQTPRHQEFVSWVFDSVRNQLHIAEHCVVQTLCLSHPSQKPRKLHVECQNDGLHVVREHKRRTERGRILKMVLLSDGRLAFLAKKMTCGDTSLVFLDPDSGQAESLALPRATNLLALPTKNLLLETTDSVSMWA